MGSFIIKGGKQLKGNITPQGAKNEALQILCAVLLTPEKVTINNIPDIIDVNKLIQLLRNFGVKVEQIATGSYSFQADEINLDYLSSDQYKIDGRGLRGSIMLVGPLLARFGKGSIPRPGGDKIGRRRLDTHFEGLINLGARFNYSREEHFYSVEAEELTGASMLLDEASVTGTANIVMAAVLAKGVTTIYNAACEPYLQQLCSMLNRMGAKISGIGSNLLTIEGVSALKGTDHRILPDMVEIGSWIGLAALTRSELTIKNVQWDYLGQIPTVFRKLGLTIEKQGDDIHIPAHTDGYEIQNYIDGSILTVADAPWPGFTPDLLSIVLVVATQARGSVLIHQKMFESRLFFTDKLIDMGAKIILCDPHRASIIGHGFESSLKAATLTSPDIRAGISLLIAALSAKGTSTIHNIEQIDRGYENIVERLQAIGANIERV
ncbi:UDP-N-acetylglucosamine 1-carboxyvinyltransferase [Flavobacteriaceae bacterium]|uniref:UDP-N-acetylglucosamine 1-carboxyvinyltransferase n=1 Tax=Candidatus Arcticimaribacter forsetii TaxID=2820661 RepID=UPI00207706B9|nr:UDP-N-acetylglucosamine 1-carboxyvinyltransferase [Candidatus Arcticimaribacter forsetii]MDA8640122.1 UDP-N-acetylglucosamine 1-carboxyvinyltransferase [Flavobacteriaceae bacterium]MDA8699288.1 UDP-N-acetylglucosamine 1-carboxyvinyltransferase [Flavobacteriaceae bacterium]MDB4621009.1 UDP-N-acetylglucosamine 1-carboxyvinyltransferase [Flavobacteriaceae bacterium]MDB4643110.1 UDP-N-acetylglucosamine 1-carboxyvinyltransferase [Flavobacteriaceae bacterium]MDB4674958.1 UDP-N-acetylglucosamine 1